MGCPCLSWLLFGIGGLSMYALYLYITQRLAEKKLERWSKTPKDLVILHGFPRGKTVPNASPFILKLETFLRMAKIPYEMDTKDSFGEKGKSPWISLNGQHISDSEFIIDFLKKKFEKNFDGNYTEEQLSVATVLRIMLDEHFFWGLARQRLVYDFKNLEKTIVLPMMFLVKYLVRYNANREGWYQGIARHSKEEVIQIMTKELHAVSIILGNKRFICGDDPVEQDCGIFSHLAQCVYALPGSPYERLVNEELPNLKKYCIRMKERYWPDWEDRLWK